MRAQVLIGMSKFDLVHAYRHWLMNIFTHLYYPFNPNCSANVPAKLMNRICHEVEEATEEVIIKTRAESEAKINKLQNEISELRQELAQAKRVAKYDLDDMARANRSLRQELEEANEEVNRVYAELEDKCDEFDALNEDTERFAETFAAQHEEVRLLERKNRRLQEENTQLKALDAANTKRISELQKASLGRTDSVSTPDDTGRRMWKELAKMRREIAHMKHDNSTAPKKSAHNARGHREQDGSCSDISSDEEEWNENEPSDAS
jgi:chromosome segregation ATPase